MFFIIEKSEKTTFEFSQNAVTVVWFWLRIKMEIQKIANLLGDAYKESLKFATRKCYVINDQNNTGYGEGNNESSNFATRRCYVINDQNNTDYGEGNNESSKFTTRKCYVINDQNNTDYGGGNEDSATVKFET